MGIMLEGIKVVDFTNNFAGPAAGGCLADFGASVIHIEKPVIGDDCRKFPPMMDGYSLASSWNNRGKKSVVLDLKDPEAIAVVKKMIAEADIVIESFRPGVMKRMGLDYEACKAIKKDVVYCSISAFGQSGPYSSRPGYDIIAQAYSGFMHLTGDPQGPPMKSAIVLGDTLGSLNAFGSIMAALYYREKTGIGQYVDVSLARGLLWVNTTFDRLNIGINEKRAGNHDPALSPYGLYDGNNGESIIIAAVSVNTWKNLCTVMQKEELIDDPRFQDNYLRSVNQKELIPVIENWVKSFDHVDEPLKMLEEAGVPSIKVQDNQDIANDVHARECRWIIDVPVQKGITSSKTFLTRNVQADFSETPGEVRRGPALGEHNYEVLEQYGWSKEKIDAMETKWEEAYRKK